MSKSGSREKDMGYDKRPVAGAQEYVTRLRVESSTKIRILEMGGVKKLKRQGGDYKATFCSSYGVRLN